MPLNITDISLANFRSYESLELHGLGDLTILVGPNASGKTNVIEAIQLLTALSSFRSAKTADILRQGTKAGRAQMHIEDDARYLDIDLRISFPNNSAQPTRQYVYNGKKRSAKDLRGIKPSVTFTPDDLNLAKGSNRFRRRELDLLGSQVNANYFQLVRDYEKVLRQKNRLLKEEAPLDFLEASDVVFQKVASQLTSYRRSLFERLMPKAVAHYGKIATYGETLSAGYLEHRDGEEGREIPTLQREAAAKRTLAGPHLHAVHFYIDGMDVQGFASQGQQRSVVLALKLAEAELVEEMLGQAPVLLLDDVMSELDEDRRHSLVEALIGERQAFITTANIDYFDKVMLARANVVNLGKE